ncbi:matrixin [Halobellus rarus]|uniref:Matrixin n=1 Tax=Halobellus rarus TaxID=1126237 RepID=A0ABD6CM13_9EURY|nr:matrixin [Halobellus rarus]
MSNRSRRLAAASLALLLALSGCVGPVIDFPSPTTVEGGSQETPGERGTETAPRTTSGASIDGETPTATAVPDATNPWGTEPIVVAVRDTAGTGREWTPLVREATEFWESNAERFAGFPVDYEVRPDASDPDLIVEFVDEVPECDGATDAAGCAPLIEDRRQIDRPQTVSVKTGFSDESTVLVTEHELGHTLGLTHDDAPADVMASRSVLYTEPQPNATERAFPWDDAEFTVYVDTANASDPEEARQQIDHALEHYEDGAEGMPTNLSFTTVGDPEEAEIVVRSVETSPCGEGAASCGATAGTDTDGDGEIETYSRLRISLVDLDTDAVAWHVGYWLAYGFGAEDDAEKPPPFRDASYDDRRSEWWE